MDAIIMGKKIQELRKAKGLTQKELASKVGVTNKAVSKWERGLNFPDIGIIGDLAEELGISATELLNDGNNTGEEIISGITILSKKERKVNRRKIITSWVACALLIALSVLLFNVYQRDKLYDEYNDKIDSLKDQYTWFEYDANRLLEGDEIEFKDFSDSFADQWSTVRDISKLLVKLEDINKVPGLDMSKSSPYDGYYDAFFGMQNLYDTMAKRYYFEDSEKTDDDVRVANSIYTKGIMDFALMTDDIIDKCDLGIEMTDDFSMSGTLEEVEYANWDELNAQFTEWTRNAMNESGYGDITDLPAGRSLSHVAEGGCIEKDGLGRYAWITTSGVRQNGFGFDHFIDHHGHIYKDYNDMDLTDICQKMEGTFGVKADPDKIHACFEELSKKGEKAIKKTDYGTTHKSLITYYDELEHNNDGLTETVSLYLDCIVGYIDDGADLKYRIRLVRTRGNYGE